MSRPRYYTYAEIDIPNLIFNLNNIRKKVSPAKVMAVVKADAYGHGAVEISKALVKEGVDFLAVARVEEALELLEAGIRAKILIFGSLFQDEMEEAFRAGVRISVTGVVDLEKVKKSILSTGKAAIVHVNVDTGMGRVGIPYAEAIDFIRKLASLENVRVESVYSHFSTSDERDKSYSYLQLERFKKIFEGLRGEKIKIPFIHMSNSGAILDIPESYFNMVRPGVSLYGYRPSSKTSESIPLRQVMRFITHVSAVRRVPEGSFISYGRKYRTERETSIVVLPVGYADGYTRAFTNKGYVVIKGKEYPVVGTVTMDQIMVDIGDDDIREGDEVLLWGDDRNSGKSISLTELAELIGTIPYELCCAVSKRVPRIYRYQGDR